MIEIAAKSTIIDGESVTEPSETAPSGWVMLFDGEKYIATPPY